MRSLYRQLTNSFLLGHWGAAVTKQAGRALPLLLWFVFLIIGASETPPQTFGPVGGGGAAGVQKAGNESIARRAPERFSPPSFPFAAYLPVRRVSEASAHYKPISRYQLIFTFDSAAALMGVGT